jgi:outer membrane biosynthesis protein TonB
MKGKALVFILLAVLVALFVTPVYAQSVPSLPHAFYGTVTINGDLAPVGTKVEARGEGVQLGVDNPVTTIAEGQYGSSNPLEPKLIVQGDIAEGTILNFYVDGVQADQTAVWHSGEVTELGVTATISGSPPETTEAPPPATTEAPPPPPAPEPAPAPAPEPTPEAQPAPPTAPSETPAPSEAPAPSSAAEAINWPVLLAILGGVAVVGIIILFVATRRSY